MAVDAGYLGERMLNNSIVITNSMVVTLGVTRESIIQTLEYLRKGKETEVSKLLGNELMEVTVSKLKVHPDYLSGALSNIPHIHLEAANNPELECFLIRRQDVKKFNEIRNRMVAEFGRGGLMEKKYVNTRGGLLEVKDLSEEEAMLFVRHAEEAGIPIAADFPDEGKCTVSYGRQDKEVMDNIKMTAALELSGKAGDALRRKLQHESRQRAQLIDDALNTPKRDIRIADREGNRVFISADGIRTRGPRFGKNEVLRGDENYGDFCKMVLCDMEGPVSMDKRQYADYMAAEDKKHFLDSLEKNSPGPEYTEEELEVMRDLIEKKSLYEKKLMLDDAPHSLYTFNFTNMAESIETVKQGSDINQALYDESIARYEEYRDSEPLLTIEQQRMGELAMDGRDDIFDEEFHEEIGEDAQDYTEYLYDMNMNGIPDVMEELDR